MLIKQIPPASLMAKIRNGLLVKIGAFTFKIALENDSAIQDFIQNYADFQLASSDDIIDFNIKIGAPNLLRKWVKKHVTFKVNEHTPFLPLPTNQAYAMLEWGMNWCIANHAHHFFILHAAAVEKNGVAIILPGTPGAGKSTLCAGLVCRGWRLLSDELTLIARDSGKIAPVTRPINLKNNSIALLKAFEPTVKFSQTALDTHKGTVALMKPPIRSVEKINELATPKYIIFPKYDPNIKATLSPVFESPPISEIISNSFNYNVLGLHGFNALAALLQQVDCHSFTYNKLDDAVELFDKLAVSS